MHKPLIILFLNKLSDELTHLLIIIDSAYTILYVNYLNRDPEQELNVNTKRQPTTNYSEVTNLQNCPKTN